MTRIPLAALVLSVHLVVQTAHAGPPFPVEDLTTGTGLVGSEPEQFVEFGGLTYFVALHPGVGQDLWRTDGTAAGTALVRDIQPGPGCSSRTAMQARLADPGYQVAQLGREEE